MAKKNTVFVLDKYWRHIEIDMENPDPLYRTHCAICFRPLFPEWQNQAGIREIGEDAICGICWKCAYYGNDKKLRVPTPEQMKELRQEELKERAKKRSKHYIPKKKRKAAEARGRAMAKRPCGCAARGRHRADCPLRKKDEA